MGRGGGGRRGREGRARRCQRRQLCERVQCVRERVSESQCGAEFRGGGSPGRARSGLQRPTPPPQATASPFPPPSDPPWPSARVRSYLSPPPLARTSPLLRAHLGPLDPRPPDAPHSLPALVDPSALSLGGKWAGWGAVSLGGGASGDPSAQTIVDARGRGHLHPQRRQERAPRWPLSSLHSGCPREPGSGVGLIRPRLPAPLPLRWAPSPASPPAVLRRKGGEGARADRLQGFSFSPGRARGGRTRDARQHRGGPAQR